MYSLSKKYSGFCYVFQDLLKSYVKLDQLEGILQFFGPKNVLLSFSSELSFYPKKRRMTPKQFFSFFLYLTGKYDRQSLTKRQAPKYYIFHLGRQSKNSNIRNLEKVPKHYRSPSQTKNFFSTLSERTLCCCCLLPKFLNEGRGLVESAFFLFLFFFIHFPCSYLGNMFPHCQSESESDLFYSDTFDKTLVLAVYDYDRFSSSDQQSTYSKYIRKPPACLLWSFTVHAPFIQSSYQD